MPIAARKQEDAAQIGRRPLHREADQHIERAGELADGRDRGGEGDRERQRPQAVTDQLERPRLQRGLVHDAGGRDLHQHGEPQHGEQHQRGAGERQARFSGSARVRPQRRAAAHAVGAHVGPERRHDLEHGRSRGTRAAAAGHGARAAPARIMTWGRGRGRTTIRLQQRRDAVGKLAHGVADRRDLAGDGRGRHGLGDAEGARRRAPRPVELDGRLGQQVQGAALVDVEALDVDADGGVGVGGDGAALAVDGAAGQALRQARPTSTRPSMPPSGSPHQSFDMTSSL